MIEAHANKNSISFPTSTAATNSKNCIPLNSPFFGFLENQDGVFVPIERDNPKPSLIDSHIASGIQITHPFIHEHMASIIRTTIGESNWVLIGSTTARNQVKYMVHQYGGDISKKDHDELLHAFTNIASFTIGLALYYGALNKGTHIGDSFFPVFDKQEVNAITASFFANHTLKQDLKDKLHRELHFANDPEARKALGIDDDMSNFLTTDWGKSVYLLCLQVVDCMINNPNQTLLPDIASSRISGDLQYAQTQLYAHAWNVAMQTAHKLMGVQPLFPPHSKNLI